MTANGSDWTSTPSVSSNVATYKVTIPKRTITNISATVAALALGTTAPDKVGTVTVSGGSNSEDITNVAWASDFTNLLADRKPAAGSGTHSATFEVNAPAGYKFDTTTGNEPSVSITGYSTSVVVDSDSKATVTITQAQTAKKVTSISAGSFVDATIAPGANMAASEISDSATVTFTYNDGSTSSPIAYADFGTNGLSLVVSSSTPSGDVTASPTAYSGSAGDSITVYAKYKPGTYPITSGATALYDSAGGINVANAAIDEASVTFTYPSVGAATVATGSVPAADSDKYEVTGITWSGTLNYGETVTAAVTLKAKENYSFVDDPSKVSVTASNAATATAATGTIGTNPMASAVSGDGGTTVVVTYTFTMPTAPSISSVTGYDYYDNNAVEITFSDAIVGYSGLTVKGRNVTGTLSDDKKKITIAADAFKSVVETEKNSGSALTAPFNEEDWTVSLTLTGNGTTPTTFTTQKVKNTTPYLKISSTSKPVTAGGTALTTTYKAMEKGTVNLVADVDGTAHPKSFTWTGATGTPSGTYNANNSINLTGSEQVEITATLTTWAEKTLTINYTGDGTVNVKKGGSDVTAATTSAGTATYKIYGDETYTITATGTVNTSTDTFNYVSSFSGEDIASVDVTSKPTSTSTTLTDTDEDDEAVTVNFTQRTLPTISSDVTYSRGMSPADGDKKFTVTWNDFPSVTVTKSTGAPNISPNSKTADAATNDFTIAAANMASGVSTGDHTYTFTFNDGAGNNYVIDNKKLTIYGTRTMDSVTAPSNLKHGDTANFVGLKFQYTNDDTVYKMELTSSGWIGTKKVSSGSETNLDAAGVTAAMNNITFRLADTNATQGKTVTTEKSWADFIAEIGGSTIYRHDHVKNDQVNTGSQIIVSVGTSSQEGTITVDKRDVTLKTTADANNADMVKTYDSGKSVSDAGKTAIKNGLALADGESLATGDTFDKSVFTISKAEYNNADYSASTKPVTVEVTTAGTDGTDWQENYNFTVQDTTGKINQRELVITALPTDQSATVGVPGSVTGTGTVTFAANATSNSITLGDGSTTSNATVTTAPVDEITLGYTYTYASNATSGLVHNVEIKDLTGTGTYSNYDIKFTGGATSLTNQDGYVAPATVSSLRVIDPTDTSYYYSENFDPTGLKVGVTYKGQAEQVFNWNNLPADIGLTWELDGTKTTEQATVAGTAIGTSTAMSVPEYNVMKIKAEVLTGAGHTTVTDTGYAPAYSSAIEVLPLTVDATLQKKSTVAVADVKKTYDSTKSADSNKDQLEIVIGAITTAGHTSDAVNTSLAATIGDGALTYYSEYTDEYHADAGTPALTQNYIEITSANKAYNRHSQRQGRAEGCNNR